MVVTTERHIPGSDDSAFQRVKLHRIGSESPVVDDQDIPFSYILYVIGVIAIIGVLLVGGFILWIR